MAETERSILPRPCLDRRLDALEVMPQEVATWEARRNEMQATINWRCTVSDARVKLKNIYPSIEI